MISIIIPTFRQTAKLKKCLSSIDKQSFRPWEVILVNDNNKHDEYYEYVNKLVTQINDIRITLINNNSNLNAGYCRNIGLREAKYDNVFFLDDDDELYSPNLLETFSISLNRNDQPHCMLYCKAVLFDGGRPYRSVFPKIPPADLELLIIEREINFMTGTVLFNKNFVLKFGGFNENLTRFQDIQFMLSFFGQGGFAVPVYGVYTRINFDRRVLRLTYQEYKQARSYFFNNIVKPNPCFSQHKKDYLRKFFSFDLFVYGIRTLGIKHIRNLKFIHLRFLLTRYFLHRVFYIMKRRITKIFASGWRKHES